VHGADLAADAKLMRANWSEFQGRARAFKSLAPRQGQQRMDPAAREFAGMNPMFTTRIVA